MFTLTISVDEENGEQNIVQEIESKNSKNKLELLMCMLLSEACALIAPEFSDKPSDFLTDEQKRRIVEGAAKSAVEIISSNIKRPFSTN